MSGGSSPDSTSSGSTIDETPVDDSPAAQLYWAVCCRDIVRIFLLMAEAKTKEQQTELCYPMASSGCTALDQAKGMEDSRNMIRMLSALFGEPVPDLSPEPPESVESKEEALSHTQSAPNLRASCAFSDRARNEVELGLAARSRTPF